MQAAPAAIEIVEATAADAEAIAALARAIWNDHYPGIISRQQIEYMLARRYGPEVIRGEIGSGAACWIRLSVDRAEAGPILAGFASYMRGREPDVLKLDKLYVRTGLQRTGLGSALIAHVVEQAQRQGCRRVELQVNRNNAAAIAAYQRNGFTIREAARFDIGNGFFMDDYVMSRDVGTACA